MARRAARGREARAVLTCNPDFPRASSRSPSHNRRPGAAERAAGCRYLAPHAPSTPRPPPPLPAARRRPGFLRHDQSKTLGEIRAELEKNGFFQKFPPAGTEVVSWYVMMGIGQVVTLRFPVDRLRDVNLALEQSAWGAFRTDFYPTYDYKQIAETERKKK